MSDLVIGMGEVGRALALFLDCPGRDVELPDPTGFDEANTPEVIHIAFPWSPSFEESVLGYERLYLPNVVVVHSTVPVGTCDPHGWVHSPVRGRHPNLLESLAAFPKPFGGRRAHDVPWPSPNVSIYNRARDTEAGKLWELAQFGLQVRVTQAIYEWCEANDVDPGITYRMFALEYNEGYRDIGETQFIRPRLDYVPGDIGGHCVTQNMKLLDHVIARLVEVGLDDDFR